MDECGLTGMEFAINGPGNSRVRCSGKPRKLNMVCELRNLSVLVCQSRLESHGLMSQHSTHSLPWQQQGVKLVSPLHPAHHTKNVPDGVSNFPNTHHLLVWG